MMAPMPTVMVIDDNPADVDLLREAFAEMAIAVDLLVAGNGVEARDILARVATASASRPALILLDLNMPRMHGREVLAYVKSTDALAAIPTVVLTSSSSFRDRNECLELGADAFFTKANTLDELDTLVKRLDAFIDRGPTPRGSDTPPPAPMAAIAGWWSWLHGLIGSRRVAAT
jgi:CheY-like chemotaxis protein